MLERGDILRIVGAPDDVARAGEYLASIFAAGMIVAVVPLAVGTITARYVLRN